MIRSAIVLNILCLALFVVPPIPLNAVEKGSMAAPSQEYARWLNCDKNIVSLRASSARTLGDSPPRLDLSHLRGEDISSFVGKGLGSPPIKYDLRSEGILSPMRNQGHFGTCWAFGSFGSLESTFKRRDGISRDFSEAHLSYFAYVDLGPDMPAFTPQEPPFGSDPIFDQGGNVWKSTAILSRWTGAVNESDRPYQSVSPWPQDALPLSSDPVSSHLEQVLFLGSDFYGPSLKSAVMDYGAVAFSMVWSDDSFNASTDSYYNSTGDGGGHAVLLVGWDDQYPRENFSQDPGSDGAWLVKNSWGEDWGDNGYFWMSYKERILRRPALFIGASADNFDLVYQHDPLGWVSNYGFNSDTAWFANVFHVSGESGGWQRLEAISLYSGAVDSSYSVEVWTEGSPGNPRSGRKITAPQEGTIPLPGYHTIRFNDPVYLQGGTRFSVVVRLTTPGYTYPIPTEIPEEGYSEKATASDDQGYVSSDGVTWSDMNSAVAGSSVCLKAFTSRGSPPSSSGGGCSVGNSPASLLLLLPMMFLRR